MEMKKDTCDYLESENLELKFIGDIYFKNNYYYFLFFGNSEYLGFSKNGAIEKLEDVEKWTFDQAEDFIDFLEG